MGISFGFIDLLANFVGGGGGEGAAVVELLLGWEAIDGNLPNGFLCLFR